MPDSNSPAENLQSTAPSGRPWLSILLPVYKTEAYLDQCLASIAGQVDDSVEVIALDDASPDRSAAILERWRDRFPRPLRIVRHAQNRGLSAARNSLLASATGERIWFVDSDDLMRPGAIAQLRSIITRHDPDLVSCNYFVFERQRPCLRHRLRGERLRRTFRGPARRLLTSRAALIRGTFAAGSLYLWARVFRRTCFPSTDCFPVGLCFEDIHTLPSLLLRTGTTYHEPTAWIDYRQRPDSIMSNAEGTRAMAIALAFAGWQGEFAETVRGMDLRTRFAVASFCVHTHSMACRTLARHNPALFRERGAELHSILRRVSPLPTLALASHYFLRPKRWRRAVRLLAWEFHPAAALRWGL